MKILALVFLFFFFITGCGATQQPQIIKASPKAQQEAQADPYAWDFGQIKQGAIVRHTFVFKNETKQTLTIKDVTTSCGCTASTVKNKILKPGESTEIEVKFNSKGYSAAVQQYVYVNTDDLDNPVVRFIIKADVIN